MKALQRRGYWAGVALATPFLAQFFFWEYAVLLMVPFIASVIVTRPSLSRPPLVLILAVFLAIVHVLGLSFSSTPFAHEVVKDLVVFALLLGIFLLAGEEATDGFFAVIVPLGVVTAVLGLVKMAMLDRGYLFGPLLDSCSTYPAGTALCADYNILGLLWLLAIVGAMKSRWWPVTALLVVAGMLVGSRRFILLTPFLPIVWIVLERRKALLKIAAVAAVGFVLTLTVTDSDQYVKYQQGTLPWSVVDWTGVDRNADIRGPKRTYADVMLGTMGSGSEYGAGSRIERWKLGVERSHITGSGFGYQAEFSCTFVKCKYLDYPHAPIISEWIIGGVVAGVAAVGFYAGLLWAAWKRRQVIPAAALLVTMPYALISGDTVFSLPQLMAVGMMVLLQPQTEARRSLDRS